MGASGPTPLSAESTMQLQQVTGVHVQVSQGIPEDGDSPTLARIRAVSLGTAGVSHAAASASASGALSVPLQAESGPGVSRTPFGRGRCCRIPLCLLIFS